MTEDEKYRQALSLTTEKHDGQFRIGGLPYISHPIAVAEALRAQGYGIDYQIAGLFHDLLEDTDVTEQELSDIGGSEVLAAVKKMTKRPGDAMSEYIAGIKTCSMAKSVKALTDMLDESNWRLSPRLLL